MEQQLLRKHILHAVSRQEARTRHYRRPSKTVASCPTVLQKQHSVAQEFLYPAHTVSRCRIASPLPKYHGNSRLVGERDFSRVISESWIGADVIMKGLRAEPSNKRHESGYTLSLVVLYSTDV